MDLEPYFDMPYWVADLLPCQVPCGSPGQFFAVESWFLQRARLDELHFRFAVILLKLNCYFDFRVFSADGADLGENPAPERLAGLLQRGEEDLCVLLPQADSLISVRHDEICMTVYHPSEKLLRLMAQLVSAEGLFFWQAETPRTNGGSAS